MLEPLNPTIITRDIRTIESFQEAIVLPFNLARNLNFEELKLCVIPVVIEGMKAKQAFDLLVDTGAETTVLSEDLAKIIGVDLQKSFVGGRGVGSKTRFQRGIVENIEIVHRMEIEGKEVEGRICLGRSQVMVGQLLGKFFDYSILGVLGADTIQEICLKIDYPKKYLELSKVFLA
jgi:gag-polyprotein putative aspartyl protease